MSFLWEAFKWLLVAYIVIKLISWLCGVLINIFEWITFKNIGTLLIIALTIAILMHLIPV